MLGCCMKNFSLFSPFRPYCNLNCNFRFSKELVFFGHPLVINTKDIVRKTKDIEKKHKKNTVGDTVKKIG